MANHPIHLIYSPGTRIVTLNPMNATGGGAHIVPQSPLTSNLNLQTLNLAKPANEFLLKARREMI